MAHAPLSSIMSPEEAVDLIEAARARNEFAFVDAVGEVLGEARRLRWWPWRARLRVNLLKVVAALDADDKLISEGVEEARRFLESRGIACEPSAEVWYEQYLEGMPPFERNLMLAKQAMGGASIGSDRERRVALQNVLRHYEEAAKYGSLSNKHLILVAQLRKRLNT